ncbi:MAG: PAS domain S-box protein [Phycisphaeraceae bacterium]
MNQASVAAADEAMPRHLAALVASCDDAIISEDRAGIIVSWNAGAQRLWGHTAQEAVGQPASMLLAPGRLDERQALMERVWRGDGPASLETAGRTRDGRHLELWLTVSAIHADDGQMVGASWVARDITERKRQEQALRESERRFRTLADNIAQVAWMADENGWIFWFNQRCFETTGLTLEQMQGWGWLGIHHPDHVERVVSGIGRCLDSGEPWEDVLPMRVRDGTYRWFLSRAMPIRNERGRIVRWFGTNTDITEQRRANKALRRSEEQLRLALTAAAMGTWDYEISSGRLRCDERASDLFGVGWQDPASIEALVERIHDEDRGQVYGQYQATIEPGSDGRYDVEFRLAGDTGDERWLRAMGQSLFEGEGEQRRPARFVGVVFDTTQARTARQALEQANARAEHHLARLEAVLGQMTEGLVIADPMGNVLSMNDAGLALHQLADVDDARQHVGEYVRTFELFEIADDTPVPLEHWPLSRALRGETFTGREVRVRNRRSGQTWIASYGGTPVRDAQGRVQLAIVTLRDITARKQAERRLQQLNETLEQRVAERTADAEQRAEQLRIMARELTDAEQRERRRLAQLLHDDLQQMLVAAKMRLACNAGAAAEAGARADARSPDVVMAEVSELIEQAIHTSRSLSTELSPPVLYDLGLAPALAWLGRWAEQKYAMRVEVEADPAAEMGNEPIRVLLFEAARELLLNVVKHAGVAEAKLTLRQTDEAVQVAVEDRGVGFDPQSAREQWSEGGFGLFSVRERLELMGGRFAIESSPGDGTCVRLIVPLGLARTQGRAAAAGPATTGGEVDPVVSEPAAASASPELVATGRVVRVLLTDDHKIVRQGLANLIDQQPDMEVAAEAASGEQARELTRQCRPDVVVMDVSLPGISGIDATRQIIEDAPQTCVIGLSTYEAPDVANALRSAGAKAYLNKSQAAEELVEAIRRHALVG